MKVNRHIGGVKRSSKMGRGRQERMEGEEGNACGGNERGSGKGGVRKRRWKEKRRTIRERREYGWRMERNMRKMDQERG